jgi:hypothetical protein
MSKVPLRAIIIILLVMALLSLYANFQRWRRARVETVVVRLIATPTPTISPAP